MPIAIRSSGGGAAAINPVAALAWGGSQQPYELGGCTTKRRHSKVLFTFSQQVDTVQLFFFGEGCRLGGMTIPDELKRLRAEAKELRQRNGVVERA
jgi:hypothetical protein